MHVKDEEMQKLIELHLRKPDRFKTVSLYMDGVDWLEFENICKTKGISTGRAITDFIERTVRDGK